MNQLANLLIKMKPDSKAKIYATSLLETSKKMECISATGESIKIVNELFKQEKSFRVFFQSQRVKPLDKITLLKSVFGESINSVTIEFLTILAQRNDLHLFKSVAEFYGKIQKETLRQLDVTAYSIAEIDRDTLSKIKRNIEKSSGRNVNMHTEIDKSLLGGIKLRIGNTIFDGTIANQITKMKKVLLQNH